MPETALPKSWNKESKPHKFCPGCGQALALKILGQAIDELDIQKKMIYATDIGCSLLSWSMFNVDTIQTHHGRTLPLSVGFKKAKPEAIVVSFTGDGGGYAIGAQHLLNTAMRNDPITVILINNANYAMTGGQLAPTTLLNQKTTTAPKGRELAQGKPFKGPEMLAQITSEDAHIARGISTNYQQLLEMYKKAISNQIEGRGFSFVEVIAMCPVNWHTDAQQSLDFAEIEMAKIYPIGELKCPQK
ncbi:MAG: thiamine pyrophosphate-dependent enzyme [Patescibacteria group bacterium]|nr:thiamine pyrophosphate-dependent enzyme [Patescibacteria group bacterium]